MARKISLVLLAALCTLFVIQEASSEEPSVEILSVEVQEPEEPAVSAQKAEKFNLKDILRPFFQGRKVPEPMASFLGKLKGAVLNERVIKNINKHVDKLITWLCLQ